MITPTTRRLFSVPLLLLTVGLAPADESSLGLFHGHTDIGAPQHDGVVVHQAATNAYTVGGGGANMWFKADSFHFVWKKVEGNVAIEAEITFPQAGGNAHRKGVLMIRQTLDPDSAYADVALHGDGLTSLQFRETAGDVTHEVQSLVDTSRRFRLEKIGDYVYLSQFSEGLGRWLYTGCSARVAFKAPFYVGIGVCAHDEKAFESAVFSNVEIGPPSFAVTQSHQVIEYVKVPSGDRVNVYATGPAIIQSLSWDPEGGVLNYSQPVLPNGEEVRAHIAVPASPIQSNQAAMTRSQATGESPDGKWKATYEHQGGDAVLTLRPVAGGDARVLMRLPDQADAPTMISWAPDSSRIAYIRHMPAQAAK